MNPEIVLNMLQDIFFQSLVNVVPLALFENVEFISLSTKRVFQKNAFSIWVVLHFKASQIFYFPFLQQLLQKYDKIITNTIAVLFSSSLKRKQNDLFRRFSRSKSQAIFQNAQLLCCLFAEIQKKTKSSQAPSHHLLKRNKRTCSASFHVQSRKLFFQNAQPLCTSPPAGKFHL